MSDPRLVELLEAGTRRLVRTVDAMADEEWPQPSLLPGWSRAHVVAHLTLNAEAIAAVVEAVKEQRRVPMYRSAEARDADIVELALTSRISALRDRFLAATTVVHEAVEELAENLESVMVERTPGGPSFPVREVGPMRVREVEVHHADLGLDYTAADWPPEFVALLLDARATAFAASGRSDGFVAHATDLGRSWTFGPGGPTVSGAGTALAWWATGRGSGDGLTSDDGRVPRIEAW